jgi:hypothetical protein
MIHYPTDYQCGNVLVSVDNQKATKVSVWLGDEATPRKRFAGVEAYSEAMDFAFRLSESEGYEAQMPSAESVAISLGGATFDTDY